MQIFLVDKADARGLACGSYLEQGAEGGPWPDGDDAPLLDGVHVDRIEHGQEDTSSLTQIGLLPQVWQAEVPERFPFEGLSPAPFPGGRPGGPKAHGELEVSSPQ